METKTTSFILRRWRNSDDESLVENANHMEVWQYLKDSFPHPYTLHHARTWIKAANYVSGELHRAIAVDDVAVGCISVIVREDVYCRSAELGYWLGPNYWNQGIMTRAARQMVDFAFENYNINRLFARVFEGNVGSVRVLEKAGFVREGVLRKAVYKNGAYLDEYIFGLLR